MSEGRGMSIATGALVLRSVSVFLARGRAGAAGAAGAGQSSRRRPADMTHCKLAPALAESLKKKTHFTKSELEGFYSAYRRLVSVEDPARLGGGARGGGGAGGDRKRTKPEGIELSTFRDLLHNTLDLVTEDLIVDRVFCVLDQAGQGALRFEPWVCGLSVLLRGSRAEKTLYCFSVYDLNSDGFITKDEMFTLLKNSLLKQPGEEDPDEGVRELVELALRKIDADRDGKISIEDYRTTIEKEPLLLEAFGQCLPATHHCDACLDTLLA